MKTTDIKKIHSAGLISADGTLLYMRLTSPRLVSGRCGLNSLDNCAQERRS